MIDHTHDAAARSWVDAANSPVGDFPLQNLPVSIFRRGRSCEAYRGGVAIGDQIIDLAALSQAACLRDIAGQAAASAARSSLNGLMDMGPAAWRALRHGLFALLNSKAEETLPREVAALRECLVPQSEAEYDVPTLIGDYTDFYTSIHHARAISKLLNPDADIPLNFRWIPTAYHGRASTIEIAGQEFCRPRGQLLTTDASTPAYLPCARLDYELELGVFIGMGNAAGEPIELARAENHIFGIVLLNDWSARDIQAWEMAPLGPFHAKNFATTISPWIVSMDALEPYRKTWQRPPDDPQPLPYLESAINRERGALDIQVEALLQTDKMRAAGMPPSSLSRTTFAHQYWTVAQMITHHAAGGCSFRAGDLLGTGTISGPTVGEAGAMMELTMAGRQPILLTSGEQRSFLEDGDIVLFKGWCERDGFARIGFGVNYGRVLPVRRSD